MIVVFKPKKEIKKDFILAILFTLLLLASLYFGSSIYNYIIGAILALSHGINAYFYKAKPFLKIDEQKILNTTITSKKEICWNQATSIKYFAAEWTIISKNQKIIVSKDFLTPDDWNKVNAWIESKSKQVV